MLSAPFMQVFGIIMLGTSRTNSVLMYCLRVSIMIAVCRAIQWLQRRVFRLFGSKRGLW
jgi:hypothetical protein